MASLLTYVMILLLNVFELSMGIVYNKGEAVNHFSCSSTGFPKPNEIIKLFLSTKDLKIICFFQTENEFTSKGRLSVFTSGGLAPSLIIMNSTYYGIFHFNLTLVSDQVFWLITIPRENITGNTDIAAVEEWVVRITLHEGLNIYDTEGTLLDIVREPVLQWNLGPIKTIKQIKRLIPYVVDISVTKCPCANDVALIGLTLDSSQNGIFIGVTFSGFWKYDETIWYDLTNSIYDELKEEHKGLTLIDMVLTNRFLVLLTSLGLFVSTDLRYPLTSYLKLSRANFCGFERVDYIKGKLWYNEKCFANREDFEVDYITITFDRNRTLSESSACFYGKEPFLEWWPCLPSTFRGAKNVRSVITFLIDQERDTGIYLFYNQRNKQISVTVTILTNERPNSRPKFPSFRFPASFSSPVGMVFHPRSHFLYVYGNQVWLSMDGGNAFELISDLHGNNVRKTAHSFYTSDITFITQNGKIYMTKAGLGRYTKIGKLNDKIFTLYYDHLGFIHKLNPDHFDPGPKLKAFGTSTSIFDQSPDLGFETALAPQYISPREILFFAYVPQNESPSTMYKKKFKNIHYGKAIHFSKKGIAYIRKVFFHKSILEGFYSSVLAELIEPFGVEEVGDSPCVASSISIKSSGENIYRLTLQSTDPKDIFIDTDVEKTVVIPGYSSFLITRIVDSKNVESLATMPKAVYPNMDFAAESWFLYNFGQSSGRKWTIDVKPCNYWFQQFQYDFLSLNLIKYIDVGNKKKFEVKIIPNTKGIKTLKIPTIKLVIGNPELLEIGSEGYFDSTTDSYHMTIHVASKLSRKGSTSLALVMWEASMECFLTTLVPTMKSSCSYLRTMHHIPSRAIPAEDWLSGVHKDSQGFNMIKTLPINYRPPSNMGIAIPLTDNFYHADPSKPIPRNLFHKSKEVGKYKQCANVSRREDCNCTNDQKSSHAVAFSDCKEKVQRFKFPVTNYPVVLEIISEEKIPVKPPYLVTVTEVNMRKNWQLKHTVPENVKKMKDRLETALQTSVYNPFGLNLSIRGSELFHFRVSVVPGVTFCNLVEEFQIYVDEVPLPFPGHTLIAVTTAVVLGGCIFTAFILQLHNIHPLKACRRCIRGNTVNLSSISVR
ncbi:cation channel sperm-associated protein subunit beta [Nannospalax galili]|uniref:Cation channel sperm associated auxiliary subunit beta n=1 Tax=Nannospalax galili TaxID=1026970 RepID=A0A8C6RP56_NANGA|nr:cation channel sperm-associated protein subunit beta [Nannospalax galili]